jgi:CheY-like chemotaxis protein
MTDILIIDDDADVRYSLERVLVSSGYTVTSAADGRKGLACCKEKRPDIIITDILMPNIDGIETILQLRALYKDLPILAISGGWRNNKPDLLKIAAQLGATEILAKPFGPKDLLSAIAKCLPARRQ